ncbi:hypothetical protein LCGC14_0146210 [marine sediment metagenome]|uniref:Uncharacterized protein n=1 Tax=marine sediment metagenome TaxID=412755 RepID=A0A0F9UZW9_9ZZZZ
MGLKNLASFLIKFTRPHHCPYGEKWCSKNSCVVLKHKNQQLEQKRVARSNWIGQRHLHKIVYDRFGGQHGWGLYNEKGELVGFGYTVDDAIDDAIRRTK